MSCVAGFRLGDIQRFGESAMGAGLAKPRGEGFNALAHHVTPYLPLPPLNTAFGSLNMDLKDSTSEAMSGLDHDFRHLCMGIAYDTSAFKF